MKTIAFRNPALAAGSLALLASAFTALAQSGPTPFTYVERTGVATNVLVTSEPKTVTGFDGTLTVSVAGEGSPQFKVGSGAFTSTAAPITAGQTLTIRHTSSSSASTPHTSVVAVGSYSTNFRSVTGTADRTPDAFDFGLIRNTPPASFVESPVLTLTGYNGALALVPSASAQYRINGGSWTNATGTLTEGQTLQLRHLTATGELAYTKSTIKAGNVTGTFTTRNRSLVNQAPVAHAGADQTVDEDATVTLDGSASTDEGALSYAWTQTAGPSVTLANASTATPSFTAPNVSGDSALTFSLTVTDDRGATASDTVTITVLDTRTVSIADASAAESAGTMRFNVTVNPAAARPITVQYATADGTATSADYTGGTGVITIAAGGTSAQVVIAVTADTFDENDETFTVGLSNATGAVIGNGLATGTITDDDADVLRVGSAKRSVAPSQTHIAGAIEARPYAGRNPDGSPAAGMQKRQPFGLGGNGLSDLPNSLPSTDPHIGNGWARGNYGGIEEDGSAHSIYVRAFVIEQPNGVPVAFVTLDAVGAGNIIQRNLKAAVTAATGIPADNILFGQTHSHAAPDLQGLWGGVPATWLDCDTTPAKQALDGCGENGWNKGLYQLAAEAVKEALDTRVPATLKVATGSLDMNGTRTRQVTPDQTTDKAMTVLQARESGNDSRVVGTILQYAAHPTTVDTRFVHADYVLGGLVRLEQQGGTALYYNGPIADATKRGGRNDCVTGDTSGSYCSARGYGRMLADHALTLLAGNATVLAPTLAVRHETATLPVTNPAFLAAGVGRMFNRYYNFVETPVDTVPQVALLRNELPQVAPFASTTVSRVTIGDPGAGAGLEIATIPGEGRNALGQLIRHLAYGNDKAGKPMMLLGLTHNSFGYIIPEQEFGGAFHTGELYEEIVSLGPLTAPLLRLQAYYPLFDAPQAAYAPEYITACQGTPDSDACMLAILEYRYVETTPLGVALAALDDAFDTLAANCRASSPVPALCIVTDTLAGLFDDALPSLADPGALLPEPLRQAVNDPIDPTVFDCTGPAGDPAPGTPAFAQRDAENIFCSMQRHQELLQHPSNNPYMLENYGADPYRAPARHDGIRFRHDDLNIAGVAAQAGTSFSNSPTNAEVYRPCAAGTCEDMPAGLATFEPPYPIAIVLHGAASDKKHLEWASQPLAERGYFVVTVNGTGSGLPNLLLNWLFDPQNPYAAELDLKRIGITGHSLGAENSTRTQGDPRVSGIVAWDPCDGSGGNECRDSQGSRLHGKGAAAKTPTLFLAADYLGFPGYPQPQVSVPGDLRVDGFEILRDNGVDTMLVTPRATTHLDWAGAFTFGNRLNESTSLYYTLSWFDRYVKGRLVTDAGGAVVATHGRSAAAERAHRQAVADEAFARLTASRFDGLVDLHNISQGFYDEFKAIASGDLEYGGNVPYRVTGLPLADRYSFYHRSVCFIGRPDLLNGDGSTLLARADTTAAGDMRVSGCAVTQAPPDRDGDGVPDAQDAFPDDPAETVDTDGDGIGDNADTDDDGDGVADNDDECPNESGAGANGCPVQGAGFPIRFDETCEPFQGYCMSDLPGAGELQAALDAAWNQAFGGGGGGGNDAALAQAAIDALARGCDLLDPSHCLLPFPSDHFTVAAAPGSPQSTAQGGTGRRVNFHIAAMPRNVAGKPIDPTEWNRNDGFSPGQMIITYVPELGTVKDAAGKPLGPIKGAVPITDLSQSLADDAPVFVMDVTEGAPEFGQKQLVWAEIDLNAGFLLPAEGVPYADPTKEARPALIIRPAKNLLEGHRYAVVLRKLQRDDGSVIPAGAAFAACLSASDSALPPVAARCDHLRENVFPAIAAEADVDLDPDTLFLAWDFTVASTENNVGRLRHMRDDAFAALGDNTTLAAGDPGFPAGRAPSFTISQVVENPSAAIARQIKGTFKVPSYLIPADASPLDGAGIPAPASEGTRVSAPPNRLLYLPGANAADPQGSVWGDGLPDRNPAGDMTASFTCNIPKAALSGKTFAGATAADIKPARPSLYGHGLLGSHTEGGMGNGSGQAADFGNEQNMLFCATDWFGFAFGDIPNVATAIADMSNFPVIPDAGQQGVLNFLYLARLLSHPDGFAGRPEFRIGTQPVFDTREVFYDGNSQGGILSGPVVAMSRDIHRGVFGVPGMNYSTLLTRSVDFDLYAVPLYANYQDDLDRSFIFSLMQMLWDRSENNGYAHHITDSSALDAPGNEVLLHPAFSDHQVSTWTAEVMARTLGARVDRTRVTPERHPDENEFVALETLDYGNAVAQRGSAFVIWDNEQQPPPPIGNVSPRQGSDPHSFPRAQKVGRCQKGHFLQREGVLIDVPARDSMAGGFVCPAIINDGAPDGSEPAAGLPPAAPHGLAGCAIEQDPALCQSALESFTGLQDCSFDESGINCGYEIAHDAIGVDTAAVFLRDLFAQCADTPAAAACAAIRSTADGVVPDRVVVASQPIARGDLQYTELAAATPSAKTVDGNVDDWMAQGSRIGGTDLYEFGEHVYNDFLFDSFGADDGDDARRWATLALLGEASSRTERVDALQQAAGDQLGVPQPAGTSSDHYGDATDRQDGTDLTEVRWAADGDDLYLLARVSRLLDPSAFKLVVLADTDDGAGMQGLDAGLVTQRFDRAVVLAGGAPSVRNLVTGASTTLATAGGAVAVNGVSNAMEVRIPRALLERADGKLRVAVMTVRSGAGAALIPANVAYRHDEPVTIFNERAQALALFAGSVDPFAQTLKVSDLIGGRTQSARPGPGYHERQFISGDNISNEADTENGRLQPYGLFVPTSPALNPGNEVRLTFWTHYRGGKAHSGAAWTPRLIRQLGEEQGNVVVTPRARGTSTWYTTRAHQDFFEVFADVAGTKALNQYAAENLPAGHEFTRDGLFAVDAARTYISGYSMGGFATYLFGGLYPDLFAGGYSTSGAVTQGAWTGVGPDWPECSQPPQSTPEGDANLCFVEANNGRANAQLNYRILENTRYVPIVIHHGSNDELALTPGAERMGARLLELGYRYDMTTFLGYEHFTQAIVDEWADGAHYLNLFARPANPRVITYKVVPALVKAVNEVQPAGYDAIDVNPDGAYWADHLVVRDGADGTIPEGQPVPFGQLDAESGRLIGSQYVTVPRSGSDVATAPPGAYASTPVYSPGNHSTPYVRHALDWQERAPIAGDANTFAVTLANLGAATLDLPRMGFDGHFNEPIIGTIASDGATTLSLARVGADMTVCVNGTRTGDVLAGGDAIVALAGNASVRLLPGLGVPCAGNGDPSPEADLATCYTHPEHDQCVLKPLSELLSENQRNACFTQGLDDADCPLSAVFEPLKDNDPSGGAAALIDVLSDVVGCAAQPASPFCGFSAYDCEVDPSGTACAVRGVLEVVYDLNDRLGLPFTGPQAGDTACDQPAGDPAAGSQAWRQRDLVNMVCAMHRLSDQYANPDFHAALSARTTPRTYTWNLVEQLADPTRPRVTLAQVIPGGRSTDPYRVDQDWAAAGRGRVTHVSFIAESGARLVGRVFRPPASMPAPYPAIVITTGSIQGYQEMYNWAGEGLAEAGYLVFMYDVQGQGRSETLPHGDDGLPAGMQGVPFQQAYNFEQGTRDALRWLLSSAQAPYAESNANSAGTELYNPHSAEVDRSALGLAGHSLGASAVSLVGQEEACEPGTPRLLRNDCVSAIVAWDALAARGNLKAPGLSLSAEYFFNPTPANAEPNSESGTAAFETFKAAGVDSMRVSLRSSTHLEWTYVPLILPASRYGERVSMHYTLAWFDRYVRGDLGATQRLVATHFDGSADASSIGAGTYDPVSGRNVPYRIDGRCVANHTSIYYRSAYWLEGGNESEPDLRARGCPADRDGDGVADRDDAFPDDPAESADTDGDGTGNNADGDDDNDGVNDASDACPNQAAATASGCPEDAPPTLGERIAQALTDGAAGWCRQVSAASGGAQPYEFCTQFGGPLVSPAELDRYETTWVHKALSLQDRLGFDDALVNATLLHTHNSFNAQDDNTPPTLSGADFNQYYDITGQLRMDIRAIEMDVHWAPGRAGTPGSMGYEPMLCHGLPGGQLNVGCTTEKPLREGLQEFRAWLDAHPGEFVMLYIEDDITGSFVGEAQAYAVTAQVIEDEIGERVYRPAEHGAACADAKNATQPSSWLNVSRGQVLAAGKQILLVTETCAGGAWNGLFHQMNAANWDQGGGYQGSTYAPGADRCTNREPRGREWTRTWEDSTVVTATTSGGSAGGITPAITRELMRCGLNMPGFDRLTPTDGRLEAAVWSWAANEPATSATKNCAAHGTDGRFFAADCGETRALACVGAGPNDWSIGDGACPAGSRFSVPQNGYANEKLKEAKAAAGVTEVWLNYNDAAQDGRWIGDRVAPPAGPPVVVPPGAFDVCAGAACLSGIPVVGAALVAALEPVFGGGAPTDPLLAACRDAGIPEVLCARAEDVAGAGGLSRYVDPRIGSYPPGFSNPGPVAPFGMVALGPDTEGPINYGGYYFHNSLVSGFSHVHMSAGVYKGGYIPVLPFTGARTPGDLTSVHQGADHPMPAYSSSFDHATETATAGYYSVLLARYGVTAELTATERAGFHRYTFANPALPPRVLIDVARTLKGYHSGSVRLNGDLLSGHVDGGGGFPVFFAARASAPFSAATFGGAALGMGSTALSPADSGVILDFAQGATILLKVGISYTDEAGAIANLDAEIPGWDFDAVRGATRSQWDEALSSIEVEGGTEGEKVSFYTALYRLQHFPNVHSDVDGRYRGPDGAIHGDTRPHYSQFSSWDSYRGQNQMQAELFPERYQDMVRSLLSFHQQAGFLPRWQEGPKDASHMSGDPIIPFIGEAWCRGALPADLRVQLWPAMQNLVNRRDGELANLGYLSVGKPEPYFPAPAPFTPLNDVQAVVKEVEGGSGRAGTTLEYGIADFSLAMMAQHVPGADAAAIGERSLNYRNLQDGDGWIHPRHADGSFLTPFLPELGYGFQEGTSWQYSWLTMHDYAGLFDGMGGDAKVNERLDLFFNLPAAMAPIVWPAVQNQATAFGLAYYGNQYAPGNEHDLQAPFVYNYSGEPWKTQVVSRAAASIYTPTTTGLPGNDDLGALSGWLVWTMSGLYPMNPGTPLAVVGSPVFEKVTLKRASGDLVIEAPGASPVNKFVQSASVDGAPLERSWIVLPRSATTLRLAMGAAPNLEWGSAIEARPPSVSTHGLEAFGCSL